MHASVNMGCQGKSGPGKIHEVILVNLNIIFISRVLRVSTTINEFNDCVSVRCSSVSLPLFT